MDSKFVVAGKLKAVREQNRQSMEEFAEELQIGRSSLYELENAIGNCRLDTLDRIASRLKVPSAALLATDIPPREFCTIRAFFNGYTQFLELSEPDREAAVRATSELIRIFTPKSARSKECKR